MTDPYSPDSYAQEFRCEHGTVVARRNERGVWSGSGCIRCEIHARVARMDVRPDVSDIEEGSEFDGPVCI